ncbi:MAG TPA: MarR family transcriptional regulator [Candidatus Dormibacteraeota bacterium]|jgi:DNA-binding MarR family transcriptional regulator|nr:MarR family transcriptional regulator [Candidatus Dormibacteraeota bacterium]
MIEGFHSTIAAVGLLHRVRDDELLRRHGLHAGQEFVLAYLWEEDGLAPGEIARRRGCETATVTVSAQRLERAGLVRRERDDSDRRLVRIRLTDAGRALRAPVTAVMDELTEESLEGLDAADRDHLLVLLRRVQGNLKRRDVRSSYH